MQVREFTALDVTVDRTQKKMTIVWGDEHASNYGFDYLRSVCPCAQCDNTKHGGPPVNDGSMNIENFKEIAMSDVQEVGRYALRFTWSDGHDTGIFSYNYLRSKCLCGECVTKWKME
jgi:DUF971 family protein